MNVFGTRGGEEGEDGFEASGRVGRGGVDGEGVGFVDDELEGELREGGRRKEEGGKKREKESVDVDEETRLESKPPPSSFLATPHQRLTSSAKAR